MDTPTTLLLIAGAFNILLGATLLIHGPRNKPNLIYIILVGILVAWIFSIISLRLASSATAARLSLSTAYALGAAIPVIFWHFVNFFINRPIRTITTVVLVGISIFFALLAYLSPDFINSIGQIAQRNKTIQVGYWHTLFIVYLISVMGYAFFELFGEYKKSSQKEVRSQLAPVLIGTLLTTVIGVSFNVFLVEFGIAEYISWGPISTVIMVAFIGYAIIRHNFMNIRVIGAEFFTLLLILLLSVRLILSRGPIDTLINIFALAFATGFGILLVRSVISEVKDKERISQLAKELLAANEKLKQLDQTKSEFIAIASHQLRTPLSAIKGYLSMALEGSFGPLSLGLQEKLSRVYKTNERLIRLVNDLLNVSKIEGGKMEYRFAEFDLGKLLMRLVEEFEEVIRERGLKLKKEIPENLPKIYGDEEKLFHVFANLLDNAVHYTVSGWIEIRASWDKDAKKIIAAIQDTGIGLEPDDMNRLYTKFARGHIGTHAYTEGAGLGLFVAKNIVEAHGGKIWAESEGRGKGSTFFVELPIQPRISKS